MSMLEWQKSLAELRDKAYGTIKQRADEPTNGYVSEEGTFYTFAIEYSFIGPQAVLAVSWRDGSFFEVNQKWRKELEEIFGPFEMSMGRQYPKRGYTIHFSNKITGKIVVKSTSQEAVE